MKYFTKEYLTFFKNLAANNRKEWFDENRKNYESTVREPFKRFIRDLIVAVHRLNPEVNIEPKDAIFRLNRDLRFSKDKTPYKLFNSAIISKTGRKDKSYPGMYIELSPERLAIYGGIYMPDREQIQKIRLFMIQNANRFKNIITEKEFVDTYGSVKGEQHKRLPKEFQKAAETQNLLYNKQWYYVTTLPAKTILKKDLLETVLHKYRAGYQLQQFLIKALQ